MGGLVSSSNRIKVCWHYVTLINSEDGDMRMREREKWEKVERKGRIEDDGGLDTRMGVMEEEREWGGGEEREGGLADLSVYARVCESSYVYGYVCLCLSLCVYPNTRLHFSFCLPLISLLLSFTFSLHFMFRLSSTVPLARLPSCGLTLCDG